MEFERARNAEQKKIRIKQITDAARDQFAKGKYEDISLASVAKELSFTRANLYKYVSSKEEIFLYIIIEDIQKWIKDVKAVLPSGIDYSIEEIAGKLAGTYYMNRDMIKVLSLMYTIIEQNVTVEKLAEFKVSFFGEMSKIIELVAEMLPDMPRENIFKFLQFQMNYIIGFYPSTTENKTQRLALEKAGIQYEKPDFVESLKEFLIIIISSLS